jgi:hypothetical protein
LIALQKDAEKYKKKRSAEDSPGFEINNAICNANKSAKGKKPKRSRRPRLTAAKTKKT